LVGDEHALGMDMHHLGVFLIRHQDLMEIL
jgi:hypothetical protein